MVRWVVGSILLGVDPLSFFSFQPVLHDWCNKGSGMCYPVCGMVHLKEPLPLIDKSSPCGGSGFPLSLSDWSFTICPTPYNVLSASLNTTFPSFLPIYLMFLFIVAASRHACSDTQQSWDLESCLAAVKRQVEDPDLFWFGSGYGGFCRSRSEFSTDCYNPRPADVDSVVSRVFEPGSYDSKQIDKFLEVTYVSQPGNSYLIS